jgi:dTDP-4-amino-4,6-dideoxygalactose transaminase
VRDAFLPFGSPSISEEEIAAVADVLRSGWIGMGPKTLEFEAAFAAHVGARHAVAVSSCTAGLHLALEAAGVGPGHEAITTAMTFVATVNAIVHCGATPVLVDVDRRTLNMDLDAVERAITPRTRAILPVHFGGLPCDLGRIRELARAHGLVIVEDAAHAVGAVHAGTLVGGHGNLACFSFYPNKNMTSIEGGMVTTDDDALADEMRLLRLHGLQADAWKRFGPGRVPSALSVRPGFKYNMTDVQAVLGLSQLRRLNGFLLAREELARAYDEELRDLPLDRQERPAAGGPERHALHLYVILPRLEELGASRAEIFDALRAENIGVASHYPAIPQHPSLASVLPQRPGGFPVAEWVAERTLSLPLQPAMSREDAADVVVAVRAVLGHFQRRGAA